MYKVQLIYFRQTGKFLAIAEALTTHDTLVEIWEEVDDLRRLGRLPALRIGTGRDLFIFVDVPDHPQRVPHLVMPPFIDDDDVTPLRVGTGEMVPLVRMPLDELPRPQPSRTTTRDVLKIDPAVFTTEPCLDTGVASDEEITPVDQPITKSPDKKP